MVEQMQMNGVGVAEMQHAALGEARRLMREAKGDRRVAAHEAGDAEDGTVSSLAANTRNYQAVLAGAGAVIGGVFGGPGGAAAGGAIGGVIGYIVDDCKD